MCVADILADTLHMFKSKHKLDTEAKGSTGFRILKTLI